MHTAQLMSAGSAGTTTISVEGDSYLVHYARHRKSLRIVNIDMGSHESFKTKYL